MELLLDSGTTTLSYWMHWRVLLCAIWVFGSLIIALIMIWKYEGSIFSKSGKQMTEQERAWFVYNEAAWKPCVKEIDPIWLMAFRIIAFCLLLFGVTADAVIHGGGLFYYYTQWTFTLVTIYFLFGSLLSIYGCFQHHKRCGPHHMRVDAEKGLHVPLIRGEAENGVRTIKDLNHQGEMFVLQTAAFWGYLFQIMFQMTAGAVMLTDCVYWSVIVPFLTIRDYKMSFLTVLAHSLNAVLLVGDTALNCLSFPWFRISYFIILTSVYVIFEWIVHACVAIWWPYPFLDLSSSYSPLWYLVVALLHIPCYGMFALIVRTKQYLLSKWFPQSYQCLR